MRRLVPSPWLSLGLFGGWLLLARQPTWGTVLTGLVVAIAVPLATAPLRPTPGRLRRWDRLAMLVLRVGYEVIHSAVDVAAGVLRSSRTPPRSAFVTIPLELRDEHALAALAIITTVIPGTVWTELAPDRSAVRLHVFDLDDEATFVALYKTRYERPLLEIFG